MIRDYFSYPKINIFFKILKIDNYCNIASRYMKITDNYVDILTIKDGNIFKITGNCGCKLEDNLVFKAKEILKLDLLNISINDINKRNLSDKIKYLDRFHINIDKNIPIFAGLGGGSSNAASYLIAMNELLELNLTNDELSSIAFKIGSDVCFFVYDFFSANIFGKGDIVENFNENLHLESNKINISKKTFEIITPPIKCATNKVFDKFKNTDKYKNKLGKGIKTLINLDSISIINSKYDISFLNDLYLPALDIYPELIEYASDGYYFSGSGSSFFRLKD